MSLFFVFWVLFVAGSGAVVVWIAAAAKARNRFGWSVATAAITIAASFVANDAALALAQESAEPSVLVGLFGPMAAFATPVLCGLVLQLLPPSLSAFRGPSIAVFRMADRRSNGGVAELLFEESCIRLRSPSEAIVIPWDRVRVSERDGECVVLGYLDEANGTQRLLLQPQGGADSRSARIHASEWVKRRIVERASRIERNENDPG